MRPLRLRSIQRRPGVAYVLAMLYLMLFAVLGIGFYAGSTMSVQIARNDRSGADAQAAAESGLAFMQYQIGRLILPATTADEDLLPTVARMLCDQLNSSPNLNGHSVAFAENGIDIPGGDNFIALDPATGARFSARILARGSSLRLKVIGCGREAAISRAIQLDFRLADSHPEDASAGKKLTAIGDTYREVSP